MKISRLSFLILFFIIDCSRSTLIIPSILDSPKAQRNICRDTRIEKENIKLMESNPENNDLTPYVKCVNDAILKVSMAELKLSSKEDCPLQFLRNKKIPYYKCKTNNYGNYNITNIMKLL